MGFLRFGFAVFCLFYFLIDAEGSFIKGKNIPRVGRSNEADGPYDQGSMGYVIKTIPAKNIPRMGRRNYDSQNHYDIPKFYQLPMENMEIQEDVFPPGISQEQIDSYYSNQMENMKK